MKCTHPITFITHFLLPSILLTTYTNITQTTADILGRVINDGGTRVTERGFCWDTSKVASLTIGNHIAVGSDTGIYKFTLTGLLPYTTYYVRSYAINIAGTSYTSAYGLTTLLPTVPVVVTAQPTFIGGVLVSGGTITAGPGFQITKRGIGYQTNTGDRTEYFTDDGGGSGTYISKVSRILISNAIYYARAYAEFTYVSSNQTYTGTVYASSIQFSTY